MKHDDQSTQNNPAIVIPSFLEMNLSHDGGDDPIILSIFHLTCVYVYIYTSHFPRFRRSPCKSQGDHTKIPKDTVCFSPKPTAEKHWDHSSVRSSALPAIAQLHKAQSLDLFRRNKLIHNTCSKSTWICYKLQHLEDDVQHFSLSNVLSRRVKNIDTGIARQSQLQKVGHGPFWGTMAFWFQKNIPAANG